jgi:hypothetical protein
MARKLTRWQKLVKQYGGVMQAKAHYKKSGNPHRRARRTRSSNRRRHHRNPSGLGAMTSAAPVKMLTSKNVWIDVALIGAGVYANYQARQFITKQVMAGTPSTDPKSYLVGIGAAVAAGFIPKVGPKLMIGGLLMETVRALNQYVIPAAYKVQIGEFFEAGQHVGYLDTESINNTQRISYLDTESINNTQGMADYLNTDEKIGLSGDEPDFE